MSAEELLARAQAALEQGDGDRARVHLFQAMEEAPEDPRAGLILARLAWEKGRRALALDILSRVWEHTASPEAGGLLAKWAPLALRELEEGQQADAKVVERLAGLLRALHGTGSILVDALQYDIIGGLAIDSILLVPIHKAGFPARTGKSVAYFSGKAANTALVDMLGRELPVFHDESFPRLMPYCSYDWDKGRYALSPRFAEDFFGRHAWMFRDLVEFTHSTNGRSYCETPEEGGMGMRLPEPQISFSPEEAARGEAFLRRTLGMPEDAWFVCVYARDGAYYGETPSSPNWYRNSDIRTFLPAIDEILARGGWVLRIGERTSQRLEHGDPRFCDYSNSPWRTPLLDLYLLAKCRFLLGTPSGLCHVAYAFRTPELMVNTINLCTISSTDLYIPKTARDTRNGEPLTFAQLLERLYGNDDAGLFMENGVTQRELLHVEYQDNSPEEIRDATVEMLARLDGVHEDGPEAARLRDRFREIWQPWAPHMADTAIAASFLLARPELFA